MREKIDEIQKRRFDRLAVLTEAKGDLSEAEEALNVISCEPTWVVNGKQMLLFETAPEYIKTIQAALTEHKQFLTEHKQFKAKKMFEELGYKDNGNRNSECELYVYENTITKQIGNEFHQQGIYIIIKCDYTVTKMEDNGENLPITYLEIQAIHQQMKELGWLDE